MLDNLIGGAWQPPASGAYLRLSSPPGAGSCALAVARSGRDDVAQAFRAARRALSRWQDLTAEEREALVLQIPELIDTRRMDCWLGECVRRGTGGAAPSPDALRAFRQDCLMMLDHALTGHAVSPPAVVTEAAALRPIGIPIPLPLRTAADLGRLFLALIQGATAVVAPLYTCGRCSDALDAAKLCALGGGLPAGVINLVMGLGLEVGVPLVSRDVGREASPRHMPICRAVSAALGPQAVPAQMRLARSRNPCPPKRLDRGPENHA